MPANDTKNRPRPPTTTIVNDYRISFSPETLSVIREAISGLGRITTGLHNIERALSVLQEQGKKIMANIAALEAAVAEETTVQQSAITLLENLSKMVKDAGTDPAKLQAVVDQLNSNRSALAAAIVANTPSEGEPPPEPSV